MPRGLLHGIFGVPTTWRLSEGKTPAAVFARRRETPRGHRPRARTDAPRTGTGRSHDCLLHVEQAASGSLRTYADDERSWEVGQVRSTGEAAERRRATAGRGGG